MESLKAAAQRLAEKTAFTCRIMDAQDLAEDIQSAILEGMKLAMEEAANVCESSYNDLQRYPAISPTQLLLMADRIRAMKGETHD